METYLEIDSIIKSYGERVILSDIYLKCVPGDIIGIFGINGSGKSTLFNILFGTCKAERSFVKINDKVVTSKAYKTGLIGFLPQKDVLPKDIKIKDIIKLSCIDTEFIFTDDIIKQSCNKLTGSLSGGELRYVEILIMLHTPAPFIILDEPFKGLSPITIEKVCSLIKKQSKNKGIIITDHNYNAVAKIANIYKLLHEGYLRPIKELSELKGFYFK